ncbi:uncharacterized protein SAPINGB_P000327 [Magnusiomyces paraingens]|uniref:N-acetyltransferase ECO1 n=1 Tax=Magnusiomyces paraingens TaxID=2606893 RepID=A0A5E8B5J5_9ASCO|nr:uncharacterized protein SAPINGB_P000327 [Saprochaete ingens]VVT44170.1 unnamed protein product [Saprochaete ingens]
MKQKPLYSSRKQPSASKSQLHSNPISIPSSDRASETSPELLSSDQDSSSSSSSTDESSDDDSGQSDVEFVLGKRPANRKTKPKTKSSPSKRRKIITESSSQQEEPIVLDDGIVLLPSSSPIESIRSPSPIASPVTKVPRLSSRVFPFLTPKPTSLTALAPPFQNKKRTKKPPAKPTQTHLNFAGLLPSTTCAECGMSYCALNSSDVTVHTKFHAKSTLGRDWTSPDWGALVWRESPLHDQNNNYNTQHNTTNVNNSQNSSSTSLLGPPRDRILRVNASSKLPEKRAVQDLLLCVNTELSAPPENQTWRKGPAAAAAAYVYVSSSCSDSSKDSFPSSSSQPVPRAVAILVVERISRAHTLDLTTGTMTPYKTPDQCPAPVMGVARIYTARGFRRRGFAARLLDVAAEDFIYRYRVPKKAVAWSQPSASGGMLAKCWHGDQSPGPDKVLVYLENDAVTKK